MEKCPLCGERMVKNLCENCGYSVPDELELSAPYNLDPSDDYPEPIREITPEHLTEEIYPNRPEPQPIEFKVREEESPAPFVNPYANQNNGTANQNQGQTGRNYIPSPPPQQQNPYANNGGFTPYSQNGSTDTFKEDMRTYWWLLLLAFFIPIMGIVFMSLVKNKFDSRFRAFLLVAVVLGFIFPPYP